MKQGWTYKKLGEVFSSINNGANIKQIKGATGIPITRIETLSNDKFNRDRMGYANIENVTPFASYVLNEGDILMSHINSMKFLGRSVAYSKMGDETIIHGMNLLRLVPTTNVLSPFMIYQFQTRYFKDQILQISHQSVNQASFNITNLKGLNIMVPSLAEQERIVERLDAAFAQIDELKSNAERQLAEARALFQAALTQAMQPKPSWEKKPLKELCQKRNTINWQEIDENQLFTYIDLSSVDRELLSITEPQTISKNSAPSRAKQILKTGDVIFATTRPTLRRVCLIPNELDNQICSTGYCVLRPNKMIISKWIFYSLIQDSFYHYIEPLQTGASYPAVTDDIVKNYTINVPSLQEQFDIVSNIDNLSFNVRELEIIRQKSVVECDALKQALLRQIFE